MDSKNMTNKDTENFAQQPGDILSTNSSELDDLNVCQIEEISRKIQRGGYLQFESLRYRGDNLAIYEGEIVILKFDPRNILTLSVYRREGETDVFLARAYAQDGETETLSLDELKAMKSKLQEKRPQGQIDRSISLPKIEK
jgi:putative transposase